MCVKAPRAVFLLINVGRTRFRTRLCSNKTKTTMLCEILCSAKMRDRFAQNLSADLAIKNDKNGDVQRKNPSLFVEFFQYKSFHTVRAAITHTVKRALQNNGDILPCRHDYTQGHTNTRINTPLSTLLFNRYCIDVKSKFYTHAKKTILRDEAKTNNNQPVGEFQEEEKIT